MLSFPSWERGLKLIGNLDADYARIVVPLVGTWIEIGYAYVDQIRFNVVPLVGTWIEIYTIFINAHLNAVVPLVGTWIEILIAVIFVPIFKVVPLVGTWIEIAQEHLPCLLACRSPRGNVD